MQPVPSPTAAREGEFSPTGLILNVIAGGVVLLAAIGTALVWGFFALFSSRFSAIPNDIVRAGYIAIGVFVVAFGFVATGIFFARSPRASAPLVSILCGIAAIGTLVAPIVLMSRWYEGAVERDASRARDRLRVNDISAIGRPCTPQPTTQGDCPTGYQCTTGAFGGPQTPDTRCQILCFRTDDYCGAGSRCVHGVCAR